jgi:hypothetical protein
MMLYMPEVFRNALHTGDRHKDKWLSLFFQTTITHGIKNQVNELVGITSKLKIMSQVVNFINL